MPVETTVKRKTVMFAADEHVREEVTVESLAGLRAVFQKDGSVTAGNASGINDGAGAVVLMEAAEAARARPQAARAPGQLRPCRRRAALHGHRPGAGQPDRAEEAPGSRSRTWTSSKPTRRSPPRPARWPRSWTSIREKVNPNGSGISIGHPVGATGAIITTKAVHELQRIGGRYALVTMCIGGGQGIAAVFERA